MADMEPSSEKRERILQALAEAGKQDTETSSYDSGENEHPKKSLPRKRKAGGAGAEEEECRWCHS